MFEEQSYKAVFSKVRASAQTHRIIRDMEPESRSRRAAPLRKAVGTVLAAVLVMMLSVTAFAAVTGAEWFEIFFRDQNFIFTMRTNNKISHDYKTFPLFFLVFIPDFFGRAHRLFQIPDACFCIFIVHFCRHGIILNRTVVILLNSTGRTTRCRIHVSQTEHSFQ